ncbi:hypothetical protein GCM10011335_42570 [Aureimonas glaciei]|uniref:Uncharacterized protein n=1 Tax=Aureimonas glaciei TaxID=1776957 RepID=A0A916Y8R5_9HYPH|nr:hypothetical protein GCM10011335_42570 [Aureimonas glaciei]
MSFSAVHQAGRAAEAGHRDGNGLKASRPRAIGPGAVRSGIPILRVVDGTKAREFGCNFLGALLTMERCHEPGLPFDVPARPVREPFRFDVA